MLPPESAMPEQHLRRVNLIERQRDQSGSEAVSSARAGQRPGPCLLFIAAVDPLAANVPAVRWTYRIRIPYPWLAGEA
jgi:hypothetical protein